MRRIVVPLVAGLIVILTTGTALGQVSPTEYLGFKDTVRALPGDTFSIPIWVDNDSTITAITMNFTFNPAMIHPQLMYDQAYDALGDAAPDSSEWAGNGDTGLWYIQVTLSAAAAATWDAAKSAPLVPYKLKATHGTADTARFLLLPPLDSISEYIPKGSAMRVAYLKFKVDSNAVVGTSSVLHVFEEITAEKQMSEFSEEWYINGVRSDVSVKPTLYNSIFIVGE
ncbi:MAG: cohesin domain-containing protein, partial [candidate division Zixibacteria bacterium]|nr:cohesin domain-containing protein [candidate division Zixibacteria bacterium]